MRNSNKLSRDMQFVTNRLGYGLRAEEYQAVQKQSVTVWLEDQLAVPADDEPLVKKQLDACKLRIKYKAVEDKWPDMDELRPLTSLNKPIEELWRVFDTNQQMNGKEKSHPRNEVIAATMIRAVYSRYQLRETMTQFWHDHFHVNVFADDHIAAAFPIYDREVIRKNCFGNFRTLLEAVATSACMQYYLSNHSSRAGAANENYARELFELHSFGRENYFNDIYNRWRDVPGAVEGHAAGYIDQDVYEAARAFTGWTIADGGKIDNGRALAASGNFYYVENWHDGYQKRVLGVEFEPFAQPMADGRKVLDLIAEHPATARHMAAKLCTRLAGPNPPVALTARVAEAWRKNADAPDQIARLLRLIVQSPEFLQSHTQKVKRPLALMANYLRVMGCDFAPNEEVFTQLANAGQRLFAAPTPVGLPDDNALFLAANAMRNRWDLLSGLAVNQWKNGNIDVLSALDAWGRKGVQEADLVAECFSLLGVPATKNLIAGTAETINGMSLPSPVKLAVASGIAAMSPEFQVC